MAIKVYRPRIEVKARKLVRRSGSGVAERFSGADRDVDLTPFLSEGGAVKVTKSIMEPAGGFQIALADQVDRAIRDSLYGRLEPMDMIEIRASRDPVSGQLPLVMRGFISAVRRAESIGPDGSPQRFVMIQGQDAGKLMLIFRLFWESLYAGADNPILDTYRLQAATGIEVAYLPVREAMKQLVERVLNRRIREMAGFTDQVIPAIKTNRMTVPRGVVSPNVLAPMQGSYWDLAEHMADRPWNELFMEDEEDAPTLVFRPAPYRKLDGSFIMDGAADPGEVAVEAADIVTMDVGRSDERVANFFMVPPGSSLLDASQLVTVQMIATGAPFDTNYGNNRPELYGLRKMQAETHLLPDGIAEPPSGAQAGTQIEEWHVMRMRQLRDMNRDNSVLEEGSVTLKGSHTLKPGRYLKVTRGAIAATAYMTRVVHNIAPLDGWTTVATLTRGLGFLERIKLAGAPGWQEGRKGPYDR